MKDIEEVKKLKLYDETTFEDVIKIVITNALEERNKAIDTFQEYKSMIDDDEGLFMNGDKPAQYLEIAQRATDNITKLLGTIPKILDIDDKDKNENNSEPTTAVITKLLDDRGIGPARLIEMSKKKPIFKTNMENEN